MTPSYDLLQIEGAVNGVHGKTHFLVVYYDGNPAVACADHVYVDALVSKCLEERRRDSEWQ